MHPLNRRALAALAPLALIAATGALASPAHADTYFTNPGVWAEVNGADAHNPGSVNMAILNNMGCTVRVLVDGIERTAYIESSDSDRLGSLGLNYYGIARTPGVHVAHAVEYLLEPTAYPTGYCNSVTGVNGPYSAVVTLDSYADIALARPAITSIDAPAVGHSLHVTFTKSANEPAGQPYELRAYTSNTLGTLVSSITTTNAEGTITGLDPNTAYYVVLVALDNGSYSAALGTGDQYAFTAAGTAPAPAPAPAQAPEPASAQEPVSTPSAASADTTSIKAPGSESTPSTPDPAADTETPVTPPATETEPASAPIRTIVVTVNPNGIPKPLDPVAIRALRTHDTTISITVANGARVPARTITAARALARKYGAHYAGIHFTGKSRLPRVVVSVIA